MKIIDIYDSREATALHGSMLDNRLRALAWRGENVSAIRRRGPSADSLRSADINLLTSGFGLGFNISFAAKIQRLSAKDDTFIVHTHTPAHAAKAIMTSLSMKDRTLLTVWEVSSTAGLSKTSLNSFAAEETDLIIFHSAADRNNFLSMMGNSVAEEHTIVLPPAVALASAPKEADKAKELIIVWGGEIDPIVTSGLANIISAMGAAHHIGVKLIVAGQGRARQSVPLIKLAQNLGLDRRIEWLGSNELTDDVILSADAAIIPSSSDKGAFILGARAMGAGLPLILPAGERMEELGQDAVNAVAYTPGSIDSIASALGRLAGDPELRASLGRQARLKAEAQYDLSFGIDRLRDTYATLLVR